MRRTILGLCLSLLAVPAIADDGDAVKGEEIFNQFCKQCHVPFPGDPLAAPRLYGLFDRLIASYPDYRYSEAFEEKKAAGFIWTEQNVREYLRAPREFIPGSIMVFSGLKRSSYRDDVIAYLKTLPAKSEN